MKIQYIVYTPRHICRMGFIFGWLSTEHYVRDIFLMTSVAAIVATLMSIRFYLRITAGRCFTEVTNAPHPIQKTKSHAPQNRDTTRIFRTLYGCCSHFRCEFFSDLVDELSYTYK